MRMSQRLPFIIGILVFSVFMLTACGDAEDATPVLQATPRVIVLTTEGSPLPTPGAPISLLPTPVPFQFPTDINTIVVEPGKAVVIGRLLSSITGQPIANSYVRMAEIFYADPKQKDPTKAAWVLDDAFSPFAYSNGEGYFIFENVAPADFVVFVGDISGYYNVETNENKRPVLHTAPADLLTDLGDIIVEY